MIDNIFEYYEKYGNCDYIGEKVSQNEHMIQAAMLAEQDQQDIEVILACFFHDIGHLLQFDVEQMGSLGVKHHEKYGADFLRQNGVPEPIPTLVENHVSVKRFKVSRNKDYFNELSDASKQTLVYQGGIMSEEEANKFENHELFDLSCKVRYYDDKAKIKGIKCKPLSYYKTLYNKYIFTKYFPNKL